MSLSFWTIWIVVPLYLIVLFLIVYLENRYYDRHPEKERPDPSPWP